MSEPFPPGRRVWADRHLNGMGAVQEEYLEVSRNAQRIRFCDVAVIPGPVQTEAYARAIINQVAAVYDRPPADVDRMVAARVGRRQLLQDPGIRHEILIGEPALRWRVTEPDIVREQLLFLAGLPTHVRLGVLPFERPMPFTPLHGFCCIDDQWKTETYTDEIVCLPREGAVYERLWGEFWAVAVEGDDARAFIAAAAETLPTE